MIGKGEYNLFDHNCEHFAIWCKTGLIESIQVSIEGDCQLDFLGLNGDYRNDWLMKFGVLRQSISSNYKGLAI